MFPRRLVGAVVQVRQRGIISVEWVIYGLIALAILGAIGTGVHYVKEWGADEVRAEWKAAEEKSRLEQEAKIAKAAEELAAERKKRRTVIQERTVYVDRNIEKLVSSGACFSSDGVRELNCVLQSKDRCEPDGRVPPVKPAR